MVAKRTLLLCLLLLSACSHKPLDFGLAKDAGSGGDMGTGGDGFTTGGNHALGTGGKKAADSTGGNSAGGAGSTLGTGGANDSAEDFTFGSLDLTVGDTNGDGAIDLDDLTDLDWLDWANWATDDANSAGDPASDGQSASWCLDGGEPQEELCGTDIDEDCDGYVDEMVDVGTWCFSDCGSSGEQVCDPFTHTLTCLDDRKERCALQAGCGNGVVDANEQCDISAGGTPWYEAFELNTYCTGDCRIDTFFWMCLSNSVDGPINVAVSKDADGVTHDRCQDQGLACSDTTKTCVYKLQGDWDSCPDLQRLETHDEYKKRIASGDTQVPTYRQVESGSGECWITCQDDSECPGTLSSCYMGTCVLW